MKKAKRLVLYHFFTWCRDGMIAAIFLLPGSLYEKAGTIYNSFCFGSCRILLQQNGAAWLYASKNLTVLQDLSFFSLSFKR